MSRTNHVPARQIARSAVTGRFISQKSAITKKKQNFQTSSAVGNDGLTESERESYASKAKAMYNSLPMQQLEEAFKTLNSQTV